MVGFGGCFLRGLVCRRSERGGVLAGGGLLVCIRRSFCFCCLYGFELEFRLRV